jgi:hypothetical protein
MKQDEATQLAGQCTPHPQYCCALQGQYIPALSSTITVWELSWFMEWNSQPVNAFDTSSKYVQSVCAVSMCSQYVQSVCAVSMCSQYVQSVCAVSMCTLFEINLHVFILLAVMLHFYCWYCNWTVTLMMVLSMPICHKHKNSSAYKRQNIGDILLAFPDKVNTVLLNTWNQSFHTV